MPDDKPTPPAPKPAPKPAAPRSYTPTVTARTAVDGRSTVIVVTGAGPGRHSGTVRLWPHGQEVGLAWDDDCHTLTIPGTHDRGVAVLEPAAELRFDVGDFDADADGEEPAVTPTPLLAATAIPAAPVDPPGTRTRLDGRSGAVVSSTADAAPRPLKAAKDGPDKDED